MSLYYSPMNCGSILSTRAPTPVTSGVQQVSACFVTSRTFYRSRALIGCWVKWLENCVILVENCEIRQTTRGDHWRETVTGRRMRKFFSDWAWLLKGMDVLTRTRRRRERMEKVFLWLGPDEVGKRRKFYSDGDLTLKCMDVFLKRRTWPMLTRRVC